MNDSYDAADDYMRLLGDLYIWVPCSISSLPVHVRVKAMHLSYLCIKVKGYTYKKHYFSEQASVVKGNGFYSIFLERQHEVIARSQASIPLVAMAADLGGGGRARRSGGWRSFQQNL
jgi:hypothetical protein